MKINLYRWAVYLSSDAPPIYYCYAENEEMAKADCLKWMCRMGMTHDTRSIFAKITA